MISIDTGAKGVTVESVETLYRQYDSMDVPNYYENGEKNPYGGLVSIIPKKATFYAMVPISDSNRVAMARLLIKSVAKRKRVREAICEKSEINYNQFEKASQILIVYV